jgi:ABC-type phosphate/phosphonate transport system substrate-binding protein
MPVMSLPMYDWPEVREATDRWAAGLVHHMGEAGIYGVDILLIREADHCGAWRRADLALSQTCGYPLTHGFADSLRLIATPHYRCDGCEGPTYRSIVFARAADSLRTLSDMAGRRAAFNSRDSMSGMLALKLVFAPFAGPERFFVDTVETGSHVHSLQAVARREADVCAVDCVAVAIARSYRPSLLRGLVEIARSPAVPALPYVTNSAADAAAVARLRRAIHAAVADPDLIEARSALFIEGFSELPDATYDQILNLERSIPKTANVDLW